MRKKLENILFILGFSYIFMIIYTFLTIIGVYGVVQDIFKIEILQKYDNVFTFLLNSFFPLALILSIINIFVGKFSNFIYKWSQSHVPTFRWYSLFISWTFVLQQMYPEKDAITPMLLSCVVAALANKKNTILKRIGMALIFLLLAVASRLSFNYPD